MVARKHPSRPSIATCLLEEGTRVRRADFAALVPDPICQSAFVCEQQGGTAPFDLGCALRDLSLGFWNSPARGSNPVSTGRLDRLLKGRLDPRLPSLPSAAAGVDDHRVPLPENRARQAARTRSRHHFSTGRLDKHLVIRGWS